MDLEQEIERIAKKVTTAVAGGSFVNAKVLREGLRELSDIVAAFTRKQTLDKLRGFCRELHHGKDCTELGKELGISHPCEFCAVAERLQKGEEQPL